MQNPQKKIPNKTQLLDWLNTNLRTQDITINKIEQLGTGVGYLLLLNHIHPGILAGIRYNKKPTNQYQYHLNLKLLVSAFSKLGIHKNIEIDKLAKLKLQDNLTFLQWFYTYAQNIHSTIGQNQPNKNNQIPKKIKIKAPQKLKISAADKNSKMDIQENQSCQLKIVNSATKRINQIQNIIHNENLSTNQIKLNKIMEILCLKRDYKNRTQVTPISKNKRQQLQKIQQNQTFETKIPENDEQKKQITYVKCRKLEEQYQELIKSSILKNPNSLSNNQMSIKSKQNVKLMSNPQIFEYQPTERNSIRLTDNSILLQSDRKSVHSQNLLNDE